MKAYLFGIGAMALTLVVLIVMSVGVSADTTDAPQKQLRDGSCGGGCDGTCDGTGCPYANSGAKVAKGSCGGGCGGGCGY